MKNGNEMKDTLKDLVLEALLWSYPGREAAIRDWFALSDPMPDAKWKICERLTTQELMRCVDRGFLIDDILI